MRNAPAVHAACRDGGVWRAAETVVVAGSVASLVMWLLAWMQWHGVRAGIPALLLGVVSAVLWWRRRPAPVPTLGWDGAQWRLRAAGAVADRVGTVRLQIDLGPWMLLRFDPEDDRSTWCSLSAPAVGGAWGALRSAVFAPATSVEARRRAR